MPVRALPNGKPIKPKTPPDPKGPNIMPGKIPAISPVRKPSLGPPS